MSKRGSEKCQKTVTYYLNDPCLFILHFVNTKSQNVQLNSNVLTPMRTFLKAFSFFGIT